MPVRPLQSSVRPTYYSEVLDTHSRSKAVRKTGSTNAVRLQNQI